MYHSTRIKVNLISLDNTPIASFAWVLGYDLFAQVWLPFYLFYIRRRLVLFCFCHAILMEFPHLPGMGMKIPFRHETQRLCLFPRVSTYVLTSKEQRSTRSKGDTRSLLSYLHDMIPNSVAPRLNIFARK